jgi:thiol-disulfide isomerase/thioredoxin
MITPLRIEASSDRLTLPIGAEGPPFEGILGADGARHGFSTLADHEALVLVFSSNRCPTAKAYAGRLNDLQRDYRPHGVQVLAINSNDPRLYPDESLPRMVERAAEDGYAFPYLVDADQRIARAYGPTCTFHVFVLDRARRLRYQGRFDNSRLAGNVTSHDLRDALDDLLAGREVRVPITRPFGCSLDLV